MTAEPRPVSFHRPTWVEISSSNFSSNLRQLKNWIGPQVQLLAVLKADAYGHGAVALAPLALQNGASAIGVSSLEEAIQIRESGVKAPVLILGGLYPLENFQLALHHRLTPTVASFHSARSFVQACIQKNSYIPFHLKVDTGMGRIGVSLEEAKKILTWLKVDKNRDVAGVYSHLSAADSSDAFTKKQLALFQSLKMFTKNLGFSHTLFHVANSAGTLRFKSSHHDMVRLGISLYGVSPWDKTPRRPFQVPLLPVLSWHSKIIFLKRVSKGTPISYGRTFVTRRPSQIATIPVGYADGVPRRVSNRGLVLIGGRTCPIVGRVTMDHIMVDVTGKKVDVGDTVTLIGSQERQTLTAHDWARWAGTIPYEILCGISKRVPRVMA